MSRRIAFRVLLPFIQTGLAAIAGEFGLWQRSEILNRSFMGQSLWNSTAAYHVWPWPYRLAVVLNLPAWICGALVSFPVPDFLAGHSESFQHLPALLFVPILWYWIGFRLDRRRADRDRRAWMFVAGFTLVCLAGALFPWGYISYLPLGVLIWTVGGVWLWRLTRIGRDVSVDEVSG